ncbi:MAG: redox-regulated ATPase YchF [Anaerolineales bacterium]
MRLGIIGFPQSGKTTIFNALTRGNRPASASGGRIEIHTAVVDVPDERVDQLARLFQPEKTTYAKVTFADIAGLEEGSAKKGLPGALLNQLSQMDGLVHVVRCFEDTSIMHALGNVDPQRDILAMDSELLLNDLVIIERRIEKLSDELRKGGGREKSLVQSEMDLFERMKGFLERDQPLRDFEFKPEDKKLLSGFGFLTQKPILILLNLGDGQNPPDIHYDHKNSAILALQGKLEMELAQLPSEEAGEFQTAYGITELGLQKMIRLAYELLDVQSFFTVGKDEVRAWQVPRGATAQEAAGVIHTDLQRGFIRAEVIDFQELLRLGGLNEARAKGSLRLEGKDYLIKDGDIMHVRANV